MSPRTAQMHLTPSGIRIGSATVPRQRVYHTEDAVRLQMALTVKPRSPDYYVAVVMAGCALALVVMAFAGWLPGGAA